MDTKVTRNFTYGLFVITAKDGDKLNGCIINTGIQAASDPLTVAVSLNKADYTCDMIMKTGEFNLTFLSEDAKFETFKHFGFQSGKDVNKFSKEAAVDASDGNDVTVSSGKESGDTLAKFEYKLAANDIPYITTGANAYLSAHVTKSVDLGSHMMFIAEITDAEVFSKTPSVSYSYYFANIKPKPEAKATEADAAGEKKVGWICTICGYIYPHEELPADYICPICKHPASDFKKL